MNNTIDRNDELYHYGVKGMKWGVRRAQRRSAINKYRKDYNEMTKNDSRLTKSVNKLTGADKVYAVNKYTANKPTKTSGAGSAFAVSRKAAAAGRVAGMESKIANRNNHSKKTGFQRDVDSIKSNIDARMKTVRDAKAENKANKALKKMEKQQYKDAIKNMRKEINAGASTVGKIYNKITGADKYEAEIRYEFEKNKR